MKKLATLALISVLSLLSLALALELPFGAVELRDDKGNLVGVGKLVYDEFEVDLLQGFNDFAAMTIRQHDGTVTSFEVMVTETGDIVVIVDAEFVSLREAFLAAGLEFEVSREDDDDLARIDLAGIEAAVWALTAELEALGVTPEAFRAEFYTLVFGVADLLEAGLSQAEALEVLRQAILSDPSLEEVTTIVAEFIDQHARDDDDYRDDDQGRGRDDDDDDLRDDDDRYDEDDDDDNDDDDDYDNDDDDDDDDVNDDDNDDDDR